MSKILLEEYKRHKKWVVLYVVLCVFLAVTGGPFLNSVFPNVVFAAELTAGETIWEITQSVLGKSVASFAGAYSTVVGVSCEPFAALLFIGILEHVNSWIGSPFNIGPTPMSNIWVLLTVAIFFAISKILRANEATQILGTVTLGELEKYIGLVFIVVIGILNVTGVTAVTVEAAGLNRAADAGNGTVVAVLSGIISVFFALISIVVFFIIKTVMKGLDIVQMSLTFIPGVTFVFEVLKTVVTCTIILVNVICPPLGIAINCIIFIICCFLFKFCYRATKYFEAIYVRPLFRFIRGFDPQIPLVYGKLPRRWKKFYKNNEQPDIFLPVYNMKYLGAQKVKRYEKWFWKVENQTNSFVRMKGFRNKIISVPCENSANTPVYIKKCLWWFEIFRYIDVEDNLKKRFPKKEFSFTLSKEYHYRFHELLSVSGLTDYNVLRQERKDIKQQKREERRMLWEEKRMALMDARLLEKLKKRGK